MQGGRARQHEQAAGLGLHGHHRAGEVLGGHGLLGDFLQLHVQGQVQIPAGQRFHPLEVLLLEAERVDLHVVTTLFAAQVALAQPLDAHLADHVAAPVQLLVGRVQFGLADLPEVADEVRGQVTVVIDPQRHHLDLDLGQVHAVVLDPGDQVPAHVLGQADRDVAGLTGHLPDLLEQFRGILVDDFVQAFQPVLVDPVALAQPDHVEAGAVGDDLAAAAVVDVAARGGDLLVADPVRIGQFAVILALVDLQKPEAGDDHRKKENEQKERGQGLLAVPVEVAFVPLRQLGDARILFSLGIEQRLRPAPVLFRYVFHARGEQLEETHNLSRCSSGVNPAAGDGCRCAGAAGSREGCCAE